MKILLVLLALIFLSSHAMADVEIKHKPGASCWSYEGHDGTFFGNFRGDRWILIAFIEQYENDFGGMTFSTGREDEVWVDGPGGYIKRGDGKPNDEASEIHTQKPGRYVFKLPPDGNRLVYPVYVRICSRVGPFSEVLGARSRR